MPPNPFFLSIRPTIPLVQFPSRTFQMGTLVGGNDHERPVRQVTLSSYGMSDLVPNQAYRMYEKAHRDDLVKRKHPESLYGILWHQPNGETSVIARGSMKEEILVSGRRAIDWDALEKMTKAKWQGREVSTFVLELLKEYRERPHQIAPHHPFLASAMQPLCPSAMAMSVFADWCEERGVTTSEGMMELLIQGLRELGVRFDVRQLVPNKLKRAVRETSNCDHQPAVNMHWSWAKGFAAWMGMRLPTEAEYENAARGKSGVEEYGLPLSQAHWNQDVITLEVGGPERRNGYGTGEGAQKGGFQDGSGNAWTWCEDYYGPYDPQDLINPSGPDVVDWEFRCVRGGSWINYDVDRLRAGHRDFRLYDDSVSDVGIRVAAKVAERS